MNLIILEGTNTIDFMIVSQDGKTKVAKGEIVKDQVHLFFADITTFWHCFYARTPDFQKTTTESSDMGVFRFISPLKHKGILLRTMADPIEEILLLQQFAVNVIKRKTEGDRNGIL